VICGLCIVSAAALLDGRLQSIDTNIATAMTGASAVGTRSAELNLSQLDEAATINHAKPIHANRGESAPLPQQFNWIDAQGYPRRYQRTG
jgi:hypothetical protein